MAKHYYHNANRYYVELALTFGGSLSCEAGKYVAGDSAGSFGRAATLGILSDDGTGVPAAVTADSTLLIFTEQPYPQIGPTGASGYSGSGVSGYSGSGASGYSGLGLSGYSGVSGYSGISGYSSVSGYSGRSGYSG